MKKGIKWIVVGLLLLAIFVLTFMKTPEAITSMLENISKEAKSYSTFVHILFLVIIGLGLLVKKREPSWLEEKISVSMQNIKLGQAILNVVSTVDGAVDLIDNNNNINMTGPVNIKPTTPKPDKTKYSEYIGKISIPMDEGKYYLEFMLRENDLTEDLKKLRQEKIKEIIGQPESAATEE